MEQQGLYAELFTLQAQAYLEQPAPDGSGADTLEPVDAAGLAE